MQERTLAEILDWSTGQPAWQRDALRRLFAAGTLAATDLDDLLELAKARHGLADARDAAPLAREHLSIGSASTTAVELLRVTHHQGVNALAPEQTITFGPSLTVVYGQNAAGKSGYTRILKQACRSRSRGSILGNVMADGAPLKGRATLRYRADGVECDVTWETGSLPDNPLGAVSVFDAQCAPVYLREPTDVAFRPFSLDVFDKLSTACGELRKRLESEKRLISTSGALPKAEVGTTVARMLAALTSLTRAEDVRALGLLTQDEQARLDRLRATQRDLQAGDPQKRAQELDLKAQRLEALNTHLSILARRFGSDALEALRSAETNLEVARRTLAQLRVTVLTPDLIQGTGEDAWRRMWEAAGEFSRAANPAGEFPITTPDGRCPLCQQPVGDEAEERFKHFHELITSNAQADVRAAEQAGTALLQGIRDTVVQPDDVVRTLDELHADNEAMGDQARVFLDEAASIKNEVEKSIEGGKLAAKAIAAPPEAEVRSAVGLIRDRATQLRKQQAGLDPKDAVDLRELEARVVLLDNVTAVLEEIERLRRVAAYTQCIEETNTQGITRKSTELTKRLVTEQLQAAFQSELQKVGFTHLVVGLKASGAKGVMSHQLVFNNAPGTPVADVLSEGESRALSLATFFAELSTAPAESAIIFDDPVSSLDHIWRDRIAGRLAAEAKHRQVIAFTHDLVFLKRLLDECEAQEVDCHHQQVRRSEIAAGLCSPDLPWVAMSIKDRLGVLRQRQQQAAVLSRGTDVEGYEREARDIHRALRDAWEQAVSEVLLNDVVEPYRPGVETKKVNCLHDITPEDCAELESAMTEVSRWLHNSARAEAPPIPKPPAISTEIERLDQWVQRIRKRRERKKSARPKVAKQPVPESEQPQVALDL